MMNQQSYFPVPANEIRLLAHNAMVAFVAQQQKVIQLIIKSDKDDRCVHRIPVLGIAYASHPIWESVDHMMTHHPTILNVKNSGEVAISFIRNIESIAADLGEKEMMMTIGDYSVLKTLAER